MTPTKYSFVIPCYKSAKTIILLVKLTIEEMNNLNRSNLEFVLINDCSPDSGETINALKELAEEYSFVKVIDLAINTGQHNAIMAGFKYVSGDVIIGMDDDMQTHPSQLIKLFAKFEEGFDIVYAKYPKKKHSFFQNLGSKINELTVRILTQKPKGLKSSSFWVAKRFVIESTKRYSNPYTHLQGLFFQTTKSIANADVEHFNREVGESTYTLSKLIKLWLGFTNFSILPLRLSLIIGLVTSMIGLLYSIFVVIRKILRPDIVIGYSSIMASILFFSGITLIVLGTIGEYIGRIFMSINNSPQYIIKEKYNIRNEVSDED